MIKRILLLTALLAPALAYGANPSNDFSVQILPAGSSGGGGGGGGGGGSPTPPAAALAGCSSANGGGPNNGSCFNTLAMHMDFTGATQSFVGTGAQFNATTVSNWLDCAGASAPAWYNAVGNGGSTVAPCSAYSIVKDGGTDALLMEYQPSFAGSNIGSVLMQTTSASRTPGAGTAFPLGFYVEFKVRTTAASDSVAGNGIEDDAWSYSAFSGSASSEWDFMEQYANQQDNGGSVVGGYGANGDYVEEHGANSSVTSGYNHDNYNTFGERITQNGTGGVSVCLYVNSVQQNASVGGVGAKCSGTTYDAGTNTPVNMILQSGPESIPTPPPSGNYDYYVESFDVWTCSNWNQANSGSAASNANACDGTIVTTNP
jgi:hypothetical protein